VSYSERMRATAHGAESREDYAEAPERLFKCPSPFLPNGKAIARFAGKRRPSERRTLGLGITFFAPHARVAQSPAKERLCTFSRANILFGAKRAFMNPHLCSGVRKSAASAERSTMRISAYASRPALIRPFRDIIRCFHFALVPLVNLNHARRLSDRFCATIAS
jgi:hypothetical protein